MDNTQYHQEFLKTITHLDADNQLLLVGLKFPEKVGELSGIIKKIVLDEKSPSREQVLKQLGEIRWYLELASHALGHRIEEIQAKNIEDLKLNYPERF